jgi:hypothetical protein
VADVAPRTDVGTAQLGFVFHHADPAYVMLTLWLPKKTPSTLPGFASHYIGVRL